MTEELLIEVLALTLQTVALLSAPVLIAVVVVGLLVNILQTVTQIRDAAFAFIPKVIAAGIVLVVTASWGLQVMGAFCRNMLELAGQGRF